jgi:hypothetical protein
MTSWISFTTASVSNTFQGISRRTESQMYQYSDGQNDTYYGEVNRTLSGDITYTKNSVIYNYNDVLQVSTLSKITVTQLTTTSTATTKSILVTASISSRTSFYTTGSTTIEKNNQTVSTFTLSYYTVNTTRLINKTVSSSYNETFLSSKETLEFITWTDLVMDQVVIENTIYENHMGLSFFTAGAPIGEIKYSDLEEFNSKNSGWSAITTAEISTAYRTTASYIPYYIELQTVSSTQQGAVTQTIYSFNGYKFENSGEYGELGYFQKAISTITKALVGIPNRFPFSTSSQPENWSPEDAGETQWGGNKIYEAARLVSVLTSYSEIAYVFNCYEKTTSSQRTVTRRYDSAQYTVSEAGGTTVSGKYYSKLKNELSIKNENWRRGGINVPYFYQNAFASPDLDFSQTSFNESPMYLELEGAEITLNDLTPSSYPFYPQAFYGISVPFPYPSFSAYAKPFSVITVEEGDNQTSYSPITSEWTTVKVSRVGRDFSSSWTWNLNETSKQSASGTAKLVAKDPISTNLAGGFILGAQPWGGANFPHQTFTIFRIPWMIGKTIYNQSGSSTQSAEEMDYSMVTSLTSLADSNITISSYISQIKGCGIGFTYIQ